jgi:hypothetical protein
LGGAMTRPTKWDSGWPETICGKGSKISETKIIREWLPQVIRDWDIHTIADVGCGDRNWIKEVDWGKSPIYYQGFDIANHGPSFDCTKDILPIPFDLVLCIYVLNHLYGSNDLKNSIENFQKSGSKYLLATFNDVEGFPLSCEDFIYHKEKKSGLVTRNWYYGIFKL